MRTRALVAVAVLLLPAVADAQVRMPRIGSRPRPAELPPQAPTIRRELAYTRLPIAFESYPLMHYVNIPSFGDGVVTKGTSVGSGARAEYRFARYAAATLDMTSAFLGGPTVTNTAEIGTRFGPQRSEHRVTPYADARVGYMMAYNRNFQPYNDVSGFPAQQNGYVGQYSSGFGGVAGGGIEVGLTRRMSLTTGASALRHRMRVTGFEGFTPTQGAYWMTSYRFTVGLRFNPVQLITP